MNRAQPTRRLQDPAGAERLVALASARVSVFVAALIAGVVSIVLAFGSIAGAPVMHTASDGLTRGAAADAASSEVASSQAMLATSGSAGAAPGCPAACDGAHPTSGHGPQAGDGVADVPESPAPAHVADARTSAGQAGTLHAFSTRQPPWLDGPHHPPRIPTRTA